MKILFRLAFIVPALVLAGPASAHEGRRAAAHARRSYASEGPIRYVTLDRMIRNFAAQAEAQAAGKQDRPEILARR